MRTLRLPVSGLIALAAATSGACGGDAPSSPAAAATTTPSAAAQTRAAGDATKVVGVTITPTGCSVSTRSLPAGVVRFDVVNAGRTDANEFEVREGSIAIGELEKLEPGEGRSFTLRLHGGTYGTRCVSEDAGPQLAGLPVTGTVSARSAPEISTSRAAVRTYRAYVQEQATLLTSATEAFVAAVLAGDLGAAARLYAPARVPYERIEPVAEAFGDLDPLIDIRADAVGGEVEFTGFHRLERAIYRDRSLERMRPVARELMANVRRLAKRIPKLELQPEQIANGANSLLSEVSKSKITGEEERYSRIDLVDFQANVDGARAAFGAVSAMVGSKAPSLYGRITTEFANVNAALNPHRLGEGFVGYDELEPADTRRLSQSIDALAEPLSQVAATLVS